MLLGSMARIFSARQYDRPDLLGLEDARDYIGAKSMTLPSVDDQQVTGS